MSIDFGDQVVFSIEPQAFWTATTLGAIILLALAAIAALSLVARKADVPDAFEMQKRLGMQEVPKWLFLVICAIWLVICVLLLTSLFWTIIGHTFCGQEQHAGEPVPVRTIIATFTALTGVLAAVVAFPVTLIRIGLTRAQNKTTEDALFNDKINAAAAGLAARRQVTMAVSPGGSYKLHQDFWQDDLVTRASAIDRLEGLANERPDTAARVARMLSIYVRELSRDFPAQEPPKGATPKELREWARGLKPIRPDMEQAAQSLGRLLEIEGHGIKRGDIDLSRANLQGFNLNSLNFENALFEGASMQGANFRGVQIQGAHLRGAQMQGTYLSEAQMQGADLRDAQLQRAYLFSAQLQGAWLSGAKMQRSDLREVKMQGANLRKAKLQNTNLKEAEMQGVYLSEAQMDDQTNLEGASLQGALLRSVDDTTLAKLRPFWPDLFANGFEQISGDDRPSHWRSIEESNLAEIYAQWHAWQETLLDYDPSWRRAHWR